MWTFTSLEQQTGLGYMFANPNNDTGYHHYRVNHFFLDMLNKYCIFTEYAQFLVLDCWNTSTALPSQTYWNSFNDGCTVTAPVNSFLRQCAWSDGFEEDPNTRWLSPNRVNYILGGERFSRSCLFGRTYSRAVVGSGAETGRSRGTESGKVLT